MESIRSRFDLLNGQRSGHMSSKREAACLSVPSVMPPLNWTSTDRLPTPLSAAASIAVQSLAATIANTLLPTNGTPPVAGRMPDPPDGTPEAEMESVKKFTTGIGLDTVAVLASTNCRSILLEAALHLLVVGDVLIEQTDDNNSVLHPLDNYVVLRKVDGAIHELIFRVYQDPDTLPQSYRSTKGPTQVIGARLLEPVYTRIVWDESSSKYKVTREFRDSHIKTEDGEYEILPFYALRAKPLVLSHYSESPLEAILGHLRNSEATALALLESIALASEQRVFVNPAGVTNINTCKNSVNGAWLPGRTADVEPFSFQNSQNLAVMQQALASLEETTYRYLLYRLSYLGGNRDRVTATEIQVTVQSLEGGLSAILSSLSNDYALPMGRRVIYNEANKNPKSRFAQYESLLKDKTLSLALVAGINALHEQINYMNLRSLVSTLVALPQPAQEEISWRAIAFDLIRLAGFPGNQFLRSAEEKEQAANAQIEQQVRVTAGNAVVENAAQAAFTPPA